MKYLSRLFKGRLGVINFWIGLITPMVLFYFLGITIQNEMIEVFKTSLGFVVLIFLEIALFIYYLSLFVRRIHDHEKSGWHLVWFFIPVLNLYLLFELFYDPGNKKVNKFGSPKNKVSFKEILLLNSTGR